MYSFVLKWGFQGIYLLAVALITTVVFHEAMRPRRLPPTPGHKRPLPFIGNKLDIPKQKSWIVFRKWNEVYGPILTIWNGTSPTILIGDPEVQKLIVEIV